MIINFCQTELVESVDSVRSHPRDRPFSDIGFSYEIDETDAHETVALHLELMEAEYNAQIWSFYAQRGRSLTAEPVTAPSPDGHIEDATIQFSKAKSKIRVPDLAVGGLSTYDPS